jgi:hypothetical protein
VKRLGLVHDVNDVFLTLEVLLIEFRTLSFALSNQFALGYSLLLDAVVLAVFRLLISCLTYTRLDLLLGNTELTLKLATPS